MLVRFDDVSFAYSPTRRCFCFTLTEPGEIVAIVGHSGAGKALCSLRSTVCFHAVRREGFRRGRETSEWDRSPAAGLAMSFRMSVYFPRDRRAERQRRAAFGRGPPGHARQ